MTSRAQVRLVSLLAASRALAAPAPAEYSAQAFSEVIITRTPPDGGACEQEGLLNLDDLDVTRTPGTTVRSGLDADIPVLGEGDFFGRSSAETSDLRELRAAAPAHADTLAQNLPNAEAGAEYPIRILSQVEVHDEITIPAPADAPGLAVSSDSGADYTIPEPATLGLLALGAAAVLARKRHVPA